MRRARQRRHAGLAACRCTCNVAPHCQLSWRIWNRLNVTRRPGGGDNRVKQTIKGMRLFVTVASAARRITRRCRSTLRTRRRLAPLTPAAAGRTCGIRGQNSRAPVNARQWAVPPRLAKGPHRHLRRTRLPLMQPPPRRPPRPMSTHGINALPRWKPKIICGSVAIWRCTSRPGTMRACGGVAGRHERRMRWQAEGQLQGWNQPIAAGPQNSALGPGWAGGEPVSLAHRLLHGGFKARQVQHAWVLFHQPVCARGTREHTHTEAGTALSVGHVPCLATWRHMESATNGPAHTHQCPGTAAGLAAPGQCRPRATSQSPAPGGREGGRGSGLCLVTRQAAGSMRHSKGGCPGRLTASRPASEAHQLRLTHGQH